MSKKDGSIGMLALLALLFLGKRQTEKTWIPPPIIDPPPVIEPPPAERTLQELLSLPSFMPPSNFLSLLLAAGYTSETARIAIEAATNTDGSINTSVLLYHLPVIEQSPFIPSTLQELLSLPSFMPPSNFFSLLTAAGYTSETARIAIEAATNTDGSINTFVLLDKLFNPKQTPPAITPPSASGKIINWGTGTIETLVNADQLPATAPSGTPTPSQVGIPQTQINDYVYVNNILTPDGLSVGYLSIFYLKSIGINVDAVTTSELINVVLESTIDGWKAYLRDEPYGATTFASSQTDALNGFLSYKHLSISNVNVHVIQ